MDINKKYEDELEESYKQYSWYDDFTKTLQRESQESFSSQSESIYQNGIEKTKKVSASKKKKESLTEFKSSNIPPESVHDSIDSGTGSFAFMQTFPSPKETKATEGRKILPRNDNENGALKQFQISPPHQSAKPQKSSKLNQTNFARKKKLEKELESIRAERRKWLATLKTDGTWIKCCHESCGKWRLNFDVQDSAEVPEMWYCSMNRDPDFSSCDAPEETIPKSVREEMIETKYSMGSIVWARQDGFPWLPAMVDENPDTSKFCLLRGASEVPMKYHVTYLNEKIEFAWINHRSLKVYKNNPREAVVKRIKFRNTDFSAYLTRGCRLAEEALLLTISQRLKRFGARVRLAREIERQNRSKSKYAVHPPHSVNNFTLKDGLPREKEMRIIEKEKLFDVGDVVWARGRGFPWWPAIVDTCPIHQKFMHIPKSRRESRMYHVVYFIKNKRIEYDWLPEENLRSFSKNRKNKLVKTTIAGKIDYKRPLNAAYETAMKADLMPLDERIRQFGMSGRSEQQLILSGAGLPNSLTKSPPYYEDVNPTQSTLPSQSESIDKKFLYALGNILNGNRSESCVQNNMTKKLKKSTKIPSMSNGARNIASIFSPKPSCSKVDDETSISTPDSNFRWTKMAGSSSSSWSDDFS